MHKLAFGLLLAAGLGVAAPAHAQGLWFGVGPFGVGVGAPYAYDYGPGYAWGGPFETYAYTAPAVVDMDVYEPGYSYSYGYAPAYTYPPTYSYSYEPGYTTTFAYEPSYTSYRSRYSFRTEHPYRRSFVRTYEGNRFVSHHRYVRTYATTRHRERFATDVGLRAQASVPVHHSFRHAGFKHATTREEIRR